jgi:hypothetical protein
MEDGVYEVRGGESLIILRKGKSYYEWVMLFRMRHVKQPGYGKTPKTKIYLQ